MPPTFLVRIVDGKMYGRVCHTCGVLLTLANTFSPKANFCRRHDPDHAPKPHASPGAQPRPRAGHHGN
jgi:hypothetical protein